MKIAVLLTCFNRKDKTCVCLHSMYADLAIYNKSHPDNQIFLEVFLVDDGCTDGTTDAVREQCATQVVHIIQGTGSLFWAGGMRLAWNEAYKRHSEWDFYLLLNDDTALLPGVFEELVKTHKYSLVHFGKVGIYSGITCASDDHSKCTYSGDVWINRNKGLRKRLGVSNEPQMCDMTNANILLVSKSVVDTVGRFSTAYQHGMADYDYSIRVRKHGFPVLITAKTCGICDNDHVNFHEQAKRIAKMSLIQRWMYFRHPVHSSGDYLRFIWNTSPCRWPMVWVGRMLNLFFPKFYYKLNAKR